MCGIAGAFYQDSPAVLRDAVLRMTTAMRHRGPDDHDVTNCEPKGGGVRSSNIVLGNTRLAIQDISSAGRQPMLDAQTGNQVVFNGEIYNHLEIRSQLPEIHWRSASDTETILQAYAAWGPDCVQRLRGMFAIALYDAARDILWCARDRLGIKPFYFTAGPRGFVFASEVSALLRSGLVTPRIDHAGLCSYMLFGSVIEPYTLISRVHSLAAGHWIEVQEGQVVRQRQYWSELRCMEEAADANGNSHDADAGPIHNSQPATRDLLEASVREHLLSDVPVGCFLSGGIDSSTVTALAASLTSNRLRTFTVAFHGTEMDESEYARTIASRFHTEHFEVRLSDQEVASQIPQSIEAMDLPSIDGANTYVVSRAVSDVGLKVVLSGLGGDEVFGGYRSFRLLPFALRWSSLIGNTPAWSARILPGGDRARHMMQPGLELRRRYRALRSLWPEPDLVRLGLDVSLELFAEPESALPARTRVSQLELGGYMRSVLLRDGDIMSMAHSIELRVPFLDHRLVEHGLRHHLAGPGRKVALLQATSNLLPRRHALRAKQGFALPMEGWLRASLRNFSGDGLAALDSQAVLARPVREYQRQFELGRISWPRVWQLAVLGHWMTKFRSAGHP